MGIPQARWMVDFMVPIEVMDDFGDTAVIRTPKSKLPNKYVMRYSLRDTHYIWLVVWNIFYFPMYWECHHPN